jgi:hypothetical protein
MRKANDAGPTPPGVVLTLLPHERGFLRHNKSKGGYQDLENWLWTHSALGPFLLDPVRLERLIRCIKNYGTGGPNNRLRRAFIPALRRAGIDLLAEWRAL